MKCLQTWTRGETISFNRSLFWKECKAGWIPTWNQDCQEIYQQPRICRWYYSNGRKWRRISWWGWKRKVKKLSWNSTFRKLRSWHTVPLFNGKQKWKKVEAVIDFNFLGSKITVDSDCSLEIKGHLLLRKKAMTNLDSILKSRDITLPLKVCRVKAMAFPVVMYGCESWTIKEAECWRIDAFKLWCWRRLLRVHWTGRRSNQSIRKEISPEYSLGGLMLKLQYFGHLMWRANSLEKTLMLGKIKGKGEEGDRGWDG